MKPMFAALFLIMIATASLGQSNPQPLIYPSLSPVSTLPGGPAFSLTVSGYGFVAGSVVEWNGSPRSTTFVSGRRLQAAISASDIATVGTASITVLSPAPGGGTSNAVNFSVTVPEASVSVALDSALYSSYPEGGPFVLVADFNGDGIPDILASTTQGGAVLAFYQGNGDGTFKPPVASAVSVSGPIFGPADFNGDGRADVIVTGYPTGDPVSEASSVFLNNGDGTFSEQPFIRSESDYGGPVAVGDFAGNGKLDLLYESCSQGPCNLLYLSGNGEGGFGNSHFIEPLQNFYGGAAVGDFDGDGKLDFVIAGPPLFIFLGQGDGTFKILTTMADVTAPDISPAADLNGDGKLDLIVGSCVLLGHGDGTFNANCNGTDEDEGELTLADVNGDGKLDIATTLGGAQEFTGQIEVQLGNGDGTFQPAFPVGGNTYESGIGDFNGNGKIDFAGTGPTGISVFLQNSATLTPYALTYAAQEVGTSSAPQSVTVTNNGSSTLKIAGVNLGGFDPGDYRATSHCGSAVAAGASCTISVIFKSTTYSGREATLTVSYGTNPKTSQLVNLTGAGETTNAAFSPTSLSFGFQLIGVASPAQTATLTNSGPGVLAITSFSTSGPFAYTTNCGSSLAVNASCQLSIAFTPTVLGVVSGSITANTNAQNGPISVSLSGTGTYLLVSPLSINFGNQAVGTTSAPQTVTLTNGSQTQAIGISSIKVAGADSRNFTETNNCGSTLAAGASCSVSITFTPAVKGARTAVLQVVADTNLQSVNLSGNGT
jgi:hypothetical protein